MGVPSQDLEGRRVRAFLGIGPAPAEWAEGLTVWVTQLKRQFEGFGSPIRWTPAENLHLTLRFFGSVSHEDILKIAELARAAVAERKHFVLRTTDLVLFPNARRPRVCAVTMVEESGELARLEGVIRRETGGFGQRPEARVFHPHVTFGRIRLEDPGAHCLICEAWAEVAKPELPDWEVKDVTLFMSQMTGAGSIYSPLAVFPLG
jgi:RNA 2',3'-cyclic 3'-phosphodiesterase